MRDIDYKEEVRAAKAIIEGWSDDKKSSVRLEGTDKYFDEQKRAHASQDHQNNFTHEKY